MTKRTYIQSFYEFFAGVGLVRRGLMNDGWQCIWANDICSKKEDTYIKNFGDSDFIRDDIWNICHDTSKFSANAFLATASFPCTDLSVAGGRKGLKGTHSGTLYAFIEIIKKLREQKRKPLVLMLENVQGFLTSHNGKDISDTVMKLNKLEYVVDVIELNANHFTPQSRPRVFVIAADKKLAPQVMHIQNKKDKKLFSKWWQLFDSAPLMRTEKIRKIIDSNPDSSWGLFDIPQPPKERYL